MEIKRLNDMLVTEHGLTLLERKPDFVQNVWENQAKREIWFREDLTKVHDGINTYVEKSGTDEGDFERHTEMERILKKHGVKHIRVVIAYFFKAGNILMEFLENQYTFSRRAHNKVKAKGDALEESFDILMYGFSMDWCVENNGDLVVIDPHCPIGRYVKLS